MNKSIAGCTLLALLATGCATTDTETSEQRVLPHEREYTTGSNMPRRPQQGPSEVTTVTRDDFEKNGARGPMPNPDTGKPGKW